MRITQLAVAPAVPPVAAPVYAPVMVLSATARRAVEAYGGAERWRAAQGAEGIVTVGGPLFWLKLRPPPPRIRMRVEFARPASRLDPVDRSGRVGLFDGDEARLEGDTGRVVTRRQDARSRFPRAVWDRLDLTYFLGYSIWNYFGLPALLLRDDIEWVEPRDGTLEPRFPPHLPTHSARHQAMHFDRTTGLLRQFDYVPEVVTSRWIAHVVEAHDSWDGIPYPSKRRVALRRPDGGPAPRSTAIRITVADWRLW